MNEIWKPWRIPMNEIWKPIPGWEGQYEASSLGRIRSIDRIITQCNGRRRRMPGRILKQCINKTRGYRSLMFFSRERGWVNGYVHQLVAAAFIGPRPGSLEVCHKDGNRDNNTPGNLRYGTSSSNSADRFSHGVLSRCPHTGRFKAVMA